MSHPAHHPFRSAEARARYLDHYDRRAATWPVPSETREVPTTWGPTHVRVSGPADGVPLVLLPGINSSSLMWLANAAHLSAHHRVFAVDNVYDVGRSVWTRAPTQADDFVAWLGEVLDGLGLEQIDLLGASYGGWIAARFALAAPERVRGLVLFAPAGLVAPFSWGFILRAVACTLPLAVFPRQLLRWLAAETLARDAEGARWVDDAIADGTLGLRCFRPRRVVPPTAATDEELAALPDRTLFVVGSAERIFDAAVAVARLQRCAPQVTIVIEDGAGHDLPMARPEAFDAHVRQFLAE